MKLIKYYRILLGVSAFISLGFLAGSHGGINLKDWETLLSILCSFFFSMTLIASFFQKGTSNGHRKKYNFGFVILLVIPATLLSGLLLFNLFKIDLDWTSPNVLIIITALFGLIIIGSKIFIDAIKNQE